MARYIDIDKAEKDFFKIRCEGGCECYPDGCDSCLIYEGAEFFIGYETEDVQPVVHSKWEISSDGYYPYCKRCKARPSEMTKYCPECGARMDGD